MEEDKEVKEPWLRRKIGRPIEYSGDPLAPDLTPLERRTLSRRIANRESARRVRVRRQEELDDLVTQAQERKNEHESLKSRLREAEGQVLAKMREVTTVRSQVCLKNRESDELRSKTVELKSGVMALQKPEAEALRQEQSWLPYFSESDPSVQPEGYGDDEMLPQLWELCEDTQLAVT